MFIIQKNKNDADKNATELKGKLDIYLGLNQKYINFMEEEQGGGTYDLSDYDEYRYEANLIR